VFQVPANRPTPSFARASWSSSIVALLVLGLCACDAFSELETPNTLNTPPLTRPLYPTGLALHPSANLLAVVSSNFDLQHRSGALLLADLDQVASDLQTSNDGSAISLMPYVDAAFIPSFGNRPVWSADGARLVLPVRDDNRLIEVGLNLTTTKPRLSCGDRFDDEVPTCDSAPYAVTLAGSDPYSVVLYEDTPDRISGVVGLVSSPDLYFFTVRPGLDGFDRIRMAPLPLAGDALGVRGLAVRSIGNSRTVFATVDRLGATTTRALSSVVWFDPTRANPVLGDTSAVVVRSLDLFNLTGSSSARDLAVTPDGDAVLVLLRLPDGLLRLDITPVGATVSLQLGGLASTCREPSSLAVARLTGTRTGEVDRAIVTCFAADAVVGHDPLSLHETDAARYFGDGPFDVVIDARPDRGPKAYVSYFLDDSIGVFDLVDENGDVRLTPKGRIGTARPPREDGR
jgi:hypothetical protein